MTTDSKGVARGREMFDERRRKVDPKLSTTSAGDRGRLAFLALQETPEGRAAKARLEKHFAKPKNDTGSEFAAAFQEETE